MPKQLNEKQLRDIENLKDRGDIILKHLRGHLDDSLNDQFRDQIKKAFRTGDIAWMRIIGKTIDKWVKEFPELDSAELKKELLKNAEEKKSQLPKKLKKSSAEEKRKIPEDGFWDT